MLTIMKPVFPSLYGVVPFYPLPNNIFVGHTSLQFLPVRKVKEKAKKLRNSLTEDILSSTMPRNILAMTFRQVVLQQLWNFELVLFRPGTERSMEDLENPREVRLVILYFLHVLFFYN